MENFAKETLPITLEEEMRRSYLDYAMSVIVGRALPDVRDGLKPVHRRVLFAMHEAEQRLEPAVHEVRAHRRRRDRQVPPARRQSRLRRAGAHGAGLLDALHADRRPGQLRLGRRRQRGGHALHRVPAGQDRRASCSPTSTRKPSTSCRTTTARSTSRRCCRRAAEPAGQRLVAASRSAWRPTSRRTTSTRWSTPACTCCANPRLRDRRADRAHAGARLPDRRHHLRPRRRARGLPHRPRPRRDARAHATSRTSTRATRQAIIVDELPYQVNKKTLLERIAELVTEKKLEGISDIRDESDKSGMRVVIELKRGEVPEVVLNNLYKQTQLQDTFGINMVALVDGQPRLLQPEGPARGVLCAPARGGHAAHGVRAAQGARARPRARRPGGRAGQHRRGHRADQEARRRRRRRSAR